MSRVDVDNEIELDEYYCGPSTLSPHFKCLLPVTYSYNSDQ